MIRTIRRAILLSVAFALSALSLIGYVTGIASAVVGYRLSRAAEWVSKHAIAFARLANPPAGRLPTRMPDDAQRHTSAARLKRTQHAQRPRIYAGWRMCEST